ncbi:MAG: phenylalanine--tRNA ligase subunit beta [bacterium]
MKISYNWLKSYIPDAPEASKLADVITYHLAEVEGVEEKDGDSILDINILPNRAHDLLSHQGIARELASLLDISFKLPEYKLPAFLDKENSTKVSIKLHNDKCRRYIACVVRGIKVGPSPEWVVKYLDSVGQRSINNIVDATNIVMYDCGQPTHAFDLQSVMQGDGVDIEIKDANEGDTLKLVGREGATVNLLPSDLVITSGGKIISLAAKGGADSGVNDSTTDLLLEIDNFEPTNVRKTMRRLGIFTDAGKRFENDLSPELCEFAIKELCALLLEFFPDAVFESIVDIYPQKQEQRKLSFSAKRVSDVLGLEVSVGEIENILKRYNFKYNENGGTFEMDVTAMRMDLSIEEDMIEEIGRIMGYDKVAPIIPNINFTPRPNETHEKILKVRGALVDSGYREVMTYSFADKGEVGVLASASDKKFLRTNLADGVKKAYESNKLNASMLDIDEVKIFEIGTVFIKGAEEIHVAYADKKGVKEMKLEEFIGAEPESKFSRSGGVTEGNELARGPENLLSGEATKIFKIWSPYPFIIRDIAVWVPEGTKPETLSDMYKDLGTELLVRTPKLFDQFTKDGRTSYAFRLIFQSYERTLTDDEVGEIMAKIASKIRGLGYEAR